MWLRDLRAVTLDDWHTLRHLIGPQDIPGAIEEVLRKHGISRLPDSFHTAFVRGLDEKDKAQWMDLREERLEDILRRLLPEPVEDLEEIVAGAIESLASAIEWFPDALPTLDRLRDAGYRTALISNTPLPLGRSWEVRMAPWFDAIVLSRDLGRAKPHDSMFLEAVRHLGVMPGAVLHVGDQLVADVFGAKSVGLRAALLERAGRLPASPHPSEWLMRVHGLREGDVKPDLKFRTLEELPAAIEAFA